MLYSKSIFKSEGIFFLILGLSMGLLIGCEDSKPDKTKEVVATKQVNAVAFKRLSGEIETVQIAWEKNKIPIVSDTVFVDTATALVNIRTKSGYEFSTILRREETIPPFEYPLPDSLIAISDIEGDFDVFTKVLLGLGVINKDLSWDYGKNHLVLVGDFFDRGQEVFNCLWLVYKLEQEAEMAGGRVHFIMGNHEQLNMLGDYRYLHEKYNMVSQQIKIPYKEWISERSVIGDWLRKKNCMEKIGDKLFLHGGLNPEMAKKGWSVEKVNQLFRTAMSSSWGSLGIESQLVTGRNGPLWYRGMSFQELRQGQVDTIISAFGVEQVVVGHTIVDAENISWLYGGRVINIDLYHAANMKKGILRVLLITKDGCFEIDDQMNKRVLN
jgi:hypothetical protein